MLNTPVARGTDPASSHMAAREITASGARGSQARIALDVVMENPHRTSFELSEACYLDRYQVARRLPELEEAGFVEKGIIRRCRVSGRHAVTWTASGKRNGA